MENAAIEAMKELFQKYLSNEGNQTRKWVLNIIIVEKRDISSKTI